MSSFAFPRPAGIGPFDDDAPPPPPPPLPPPREPEEVAPSIARVCTFLSHSASFVSHCADGARDASHVCICDRDIPTALHTTSILMSPCSIAASTACFIKVTAELAAAVGSRRAPLMVGWAFVSVSRVNCAGAGALGVSVAATTQHAQLAARSPRVSPRPSTERWVPGLVAGRPAAAAAARA